MVVFHTSTYSVSVLQAEDEPTKATDARICRPLRRSLNCNCRLRPSPLKVVWFNGDTNKISTVSLPMCRSFLTAETIHHGNVNHHNPCDIERSFTLDKSSAYDSKDTGGRKCYIILPRTAFTGCAFSPVSAGISKHQQTHQSAFVKDLQGACLRIWAGPSAAKPKWWAT